VIASQIFETLKWILIFCDPFNTVVDQSPDRVQFELTDLQSDMIWQEPLAKTILWAFYKRYVRGKHPNLAEHALKIISLFGSTSIFFKDETLQRKTQNCQTNIW